MTLEELPEVDRLQLFCSPVPIAATGITSISPALREAPGPVRAGRTTESQQLPKFSAASLLTKRLIDCAIASTCLVLMSPLFFTIGIALACTTSGPIIFRQERIGRRGVPFTIFKFRTMLCGTHDSIRSTPEAWEQFVSNDYKLPSDHPSITRLGMLLRRSSLDELPQLWNVIRGEMSIVGVRPLVNSEYLARPAQSRALYELLKPGLTGQWQVEGRSSVRHIHRIDLDDSYIYNWNNRLDISLLWRTPSAILRLHHTA